MGLDAEGCRQLMIQLLGNSLPCISGAPAAHCKQCFAHFVSALAELVTAIQLRLPEAYNIADSTTSALTRVVKDACGAATASSMRGSQWLSFTKAPIICVAFVCIGHCCRY